MQESVRSQVSPTVASWWVADGEPVACQVTQDLGVLGLGRGWRWHTPRLAELKSIKPIVIGSTGRDIRQLPTNLSLDQGEPRALINE